MGNENTKEIFFKVLGEIETEETIEEKYRKNVEQYFEILELNSTHILTRVYLNVIYLKNLNKIFLKYNKSGNYFLANLKTIEFNKILIILETIKTLEAYSEKTLKKGISRKLNNILDILIESEVDIDFFSILDKTINVYFIDEDSEFKNNAYKRVKNLFYLLIKRKFNVQYKLSLKLVTGILITEYDNKSLWEKIQKINNFLKRT